MSVGALTTTFTPAPSCVESFSHLYINHTKNGAGPAIAGPVITSGCVPDQYDLHVSKYYSPGICPSGYAAACSSSNAIGSQTETVITCCPSLFTCVSTAPRFEWESTLPCTFRVEGVAQTTSVTYLDPQNGQPTMAESWQLAWYYALGYQIRLQSTDFQSTAPTRTGTGTGSGSPPPAETPGGGGGGGGNQGLSPGAAAGIGVGATLFVLLVVGATVLAFVLTRRAQRRRAASGATPAGGGPHAGAGNTIPAAEAYKAEPGGFYPPPNELPAGQPTTIYEAGQGYQGYQAPQELAHPAVVHEMEQPPYAWAPVPAQGAGHPTSSTTGAPAAAAIYPAGPQAWSGR